MFTTNKLAAVLAAAALAAACTPVENLPSSSETSTTLDGAATGSSTSPDGSPPGTDPDSTGTDPDGTGGGTGTEQSGSTPERSDDPAARLARVQLQQFDSCDAFLGYVHNEGAERVGAYGFDNQPYWGGPVFDVDAADDIAAEDGAADMEDSAPTVEPTAVEASDASDVPTSGSDDAAAPAPGTVPASGDESSTTFSETNNQVTGVDEPDIVKTDGTRVLALTNSELTYIDIADGGRDGQRRGSVNLAQQDGRYVYGQEMLLAGDRAFVIGSYEGPIEVAPVSVEPADGDAEAEFADDPVTDEVYPGGEWVTGTVVVEVDLSNPDAPTVVSTLTLDGRYISARMIGTTARVVVSTAPTQLDFVYPSGSSSEERAAETNREVVRSTTIEDWLPTYGFASASGQQSSGALTDCAMVHAPNEFAGFNMLSVITLPTDAPLAPPVDTTSILAAGDNVYASADRLYVSTTEWVPPTVADTDRGFWEEEFQTGIHRFSLPAGAGAVYEASGTVDGHLLNQFAMHDRDGTFFVATTTGAPWSVATESQIVSMQVNGDRLEQVGVVSGLGKGERIYSVRYVGNTAYVVTFREIDPFYVVDITSPTDMAVRGELKIPGFSNYLHPIGDTLVLGVGQDATDQGFTTGTKVSLFDVSNPADPRELDVWTLPDTSSAAEIDHRAFLWWPETSTAVLPLVSWSESFTGAIVLNVSTEGISEQGRISHDPISAEPDATGFTDCRVLTPDDIVTDATGELSGSIESGEVQIQLCNSDQTGGATNFVCDRLGTSEFVAMVDGIRQEGVEFELGLDVTDYEFIEYCYRDDFGFDDQHRILRSMVIGDQLWTLSNNIFQANDLATLTTTDQVTLR